MSAEGRDPLARLFRRGRTPPVTVPSLQDPTVGARYQEGERRRTELRALDEPERELVRRALEAVGVSAEDFGVFVNDTTYFAPSTFDARAALPVLLDVLPRLTRPRVVMTVAMHLQTPAARPVAFDAVEAAFRRWALVAEASSAAWQLGATLMRAADTSRADVLLELATDRRYGHGRQEIVDGLWRFRGHPGVRPALETLIRDPDVALHAMGALRRTVDDAEAERLIAAVAADPPDDLVLRHARTHLTRLAKKRSR